MLPIFLPQLEEELWVINWGQLILLVLIWLSARRLMLFSGKKRQPEITDYVVKPTLIAAAYILLRYGIGMSRAGGPLVRIAYSFGFTDTDFVKPYAELVVFSFLAAYLYYLLTNAVKVKNLQDKARKRYIDFLYSGLDKAQADRNFDVLERVQSCIESTAGRGRANILASILPVITAIISATIPLLAARFLPAGH